jgi:hypothetical protein
MGSTRLAGSRRRDPRPAAGAQCGAVCAAFAPTHGLLTLGIGEGLRLEPAGPGRLGGTLPPIARRRAAGKFRGFCLGFPR